MTPTIILEYSVHLLSEREPSYYLRVVLSWSCSHPLSIRVNSSYCLRVVLSWSSAHLLSVKGEPSYYLKVVFSWSFLIFSL